MGPGKNPRRGKEDFLFYSPIQRASYPQKEGLIHKV